MNLAQPLLAWYHANRRDLPWRRTRDPYAIWVSEVMLQQTRVAAVLEHYKRFMTRYPDVASLAAASLDDVLATWQGLGYYRRARHLHVAANVIMNEHNGVFPRDMAEVRALPGVGSYTAAAVCAIAYGTPEPAVDGNVVRVLSRLHGLEHLTPSPAATRAVTELVRQMMPAREAGDFTQALMELGALVCTPRTPQCGQCPWEAECRARRENRQDELPLRAARVRQRLVPRTLALVVRGNEVLLRRRPEEGLLAGMWEFPGIDGHGDAEESFRRQGLSLALGEQLLVAEHVFSHLRWRMHVRAAVLGGPLPPGCRWVPLSKMDDYALPSAFRAVRRFIEQRQEEKHSA